MAVFSKLSRIGMTFACADIMTGGCVSSSAAADSFEEGKQAAVITEMADLIEKYFVLEDKGAAMAQDLRKEQSVHAQFASKDAFIETMNAYLLRQSNDRHLKLSPAMRTQSASTPKREQDKADELAQIARMRARFFREAVSINYGLRNVAVFDGNIGYLRFDHFFEPVFSRQLFDAAFGMLANTDALIVDLCKNNGGHEDGVQSVISYFFKTPRHYAVSVDRSENTTNRMWSLPHYPVYDEKKPLFIVTCERTFSAGEAFTFFMKKQGRGITVGEKTRGGAHSGDFYHLESDPDFQFFVPTARNYDPKSGEDWEAVGIAPDIPAAAKDAVRHAHLEALKITIKNEEFEDLREELQGIINKLQQQGD